MFDMSSISRSKLWCDRCSSVGTDFCRRNHRECTQQFGQYFTKTLKSVEKKLDKLTSVWESILGNRRNVNNIYEQVSHFVSVIQENLQERIDKNKSEIEKILSRKHCLESLENISLDSQNIKDKHLTKDTNQLNQIISWLDQWGKEADLEATKKEVRDLFQLEGQLVELTVGTPLSPNKFNFHQQLPLGLKPADHPPLMNACISVVSWLVLIMKEEESSNSHNEEANQNVNEDESIDNGCSSSAQSPANSQNEEIEESSLSSEIEPSNYESDSTSVEFDEEARAMRLDFGTTSPSKQTRGQISITLQKRVETAKDHSLRCRICGQVFRDRGSYCHHLASHNAPVRTMKCTACGMVFDSKSTYDEHVARHEKSKLLRCLYCRKVCKDKTDLITHLSSHSEVRPFKCSICLKDFKGRSNYRNHMYIHGTARFRCQMCGKEFKQSSGLSSHKRTHSNARPTPCAYCNKSFYSDEHRKRHELLCRAIGKSFTT